MFVYSVKGNTVKLAGIICLAAVLTLSLLLLVPRNAAETVPSDAEDTAVTNAVAEAENDTPEVPEEAAKTGETKTTYNKIKTNEDRVKFLEQFGWVVESEPVEEATVKIPKTFDNVLNSYNNIQLHQGLDLSEYSGKEVTRYTYKVTNYPDYTGNVLANVIVYRNKVIGGDVCSSDVDGFIKDFTFPESASNGTAASPETTDTADTAQTTESTAETTAQ